MRGHNQSVKKDTGVEYTHKKIKTIGLGKGNEKHEKALQGLKFATTVITNLLMILTAINKTKKPKVDDEKKNNKSNSASGRKRWRARRREPCSNNTLKWREEDEDHKPSNI